VHALPTAAHHVLFTHQGPGLPRVPTSSARSQGPGGAGLATNLQPTGKKTAIALILRS